MTDHILDYRGKDENDMDDFNIEHPGCPEYEQYSGVIDYECGIGFMLVNIGEYAFGVYDNALDKLEPGRYPLTYCTEKSTYAYGAVEYDEWIEIGDKIV